MAIPFSLPDHGGTSQNLRPNQTKHARSRAHHRDSLASSTGISDNVSWGDLSISSQLLYLAMVEALRVVKEIAEEVADQDQDNLENSNDYREYDTDCKTRPKKKSDEQDKIFEKCFKYDDNVTMDSKIVGQKSVASEDDEADNEEKMMRVQVPDVLADIKDKPSRTSRISAKGSSCVPDIITACNGASDKISDDSCLRMTKADNNNHCVIEDKTDQISVNGQLMDHKNLPDLVAHAKSFRHKRRVKITQGPVPSSPSLPTDDLNKPQNGFVATNKACQTLPGNQIIKDDLIPHKTSKDPVKKLPNDAKMTWRSVGRDLAKIADSHSESHSFHQRSRHGGMETDYFVNQEDVDVTGMRHERRERFGSTLSPSDYLHYNGGIVDDFERVVGMNSRSSIGRDDNGNNHHLYNRLCQHQLPSNYNLNPANSHWIVSGITNIAFTGLLYLANNVL